MGCLISNIFEKFNNAVLEYSKKGFKLDEIEFMRKSLTNGNDTVLVSIDTVTEYVSELCKNVPTLQLSVKFNDNVLELNKYYFIGNDFYTDSYDEMLSMCSVAVKRRDKVFKDVYTSTHIEFSRLTDKCKKWITDKIKLNNGISTGFKIIDVYFSYYKQRDRKLVAIIKSDECPATTAVYL